VFFFFALNRGIGLFSRLIENNAFSVRMLVICVIIRLFLYLVVFLGFSNLYIAILTMCFITTIILSLNYNNKNINLNIYIFKLIYVPLCFIPLFCIFSVPLWVVCFVDLFLYIDFCLLDFFILKMDGLNPGNLGGGVGPQGPGGPAGPGQNPNNNSILIGPQNKDIDIHQKNTDVNRRF
jgi:hypothetical protein